MTYTLTLTPYLAAQLAACCLHAGLDVRNIFPAHISGHTAPTPAEESPAVLSPANFPDVKRLPLPQPPSLTARGEIQDADAIDWTNPDLYK